MDTFLKDVRYAIRALRRQPTFTFVTILTLALGIGANTAVFSVVNAVVLRPLGYPQPERLEFITSQFPNLGFDQFWVSLPEFVEYRDLNKAFSSVGAYNVGAVNLGSNPPSRPVLGLVTPELMPTLGVPAARGRWFSWEDSAPNAPPVAILSWELWQRSFGGRDDILEQTIQVNNAANRVVGVMPKGYDVHDQHVEIWQPLTIDPATFPNRRGGHFLYLVGRLKPEMTLPQARADLEVLLNQWPGGGQQIHTPSPDRHRLRIDPLKEDVVGSVKTALVVLQGAVLFVLLIACANLANLLLARSDARLREYAVRSALGASRGRLLRQLIAEGLVLSMTAAIVGSALAWAGLTALLSVNQNAIPRTAEVALDWTVLGFTLVVTVLTGLAFGLVPLLHLRRDQAGIAMRESSTRASTASSGRARLRSALVVAEVALAMLLVVGAGLLIRSFYNLMRVDIGFNQSQLSTFGVVLPAPPYDTARRVDFYTRLTADLQSLPGVSAVAAMSGLPPLRNVNANDTDFEHIPNNRPAGSLPGENVDFWQDVTTTYTQTMGIKIARGRTFEPADAGGAPVVLVNEALVKKFFTDRDPIGAHVKPGFGQQVPWFTIVGVVKDVKQGGVDQAAGTELYMLVDQVAKVLNGVPGNLNFVVRASVPFDSLANDFRRSVAKLDPTLPLIRTRSMDDVIGAAVARPRFLTVLLGVFAGLALLLAAVGTYGILSHLVSARQQEIGIRMALGADRGEILRLVLGRGLVLSGLGLALGLGASFGLTRLIKTMLFNVAPTDPATLAMVAGVIAFVSIAACLVPAWRATRVDPLIVLKAE